MSNAFEPLGFWRAPLIIGLIWGFWHLPLIAAGYNYPGHPIAGPAMMTLMTVLLAPVIGFIVAVPYPFSPRPFFTAPSTPRRRREFFSGAVIRC